MNSVAKIISYLFHPLFSPLIATLAYFIISPKYTPETFQKSVVLSVLILTIIIPIFCLFILKNIGWITSIYLDKVYDRKFPLYIFILLILMVLYRVISINLNIELYHYFLGVLSAAIATLLLVYLKYKVSLHMIGISSLLFFLSALSIHYEINITGTISIFCLLTGLIASSRLRLKAHKPNEILTGILIGILSQLFTLKYWL